MTTTPQQIDLWRKTPSEHQHLEFKEAKNQFRSQKLYEYCVAIANEGGGHLLLGIADKPPRLVVGTRAFLNPVETEEKVFQKLRFRVDIEAVDHPQGRVLVFDIPPRPKGTAYNLDGKYLMRSGSALVAMTEDRLRKIFAESAPDWNQSAHAPDLVAANLLGAWNEGNEADLEIVNRLAKEEYATWIPKIRRTLHQRGPANLKDGRWSIAERKDLWRTLGARVFDDDLDNLAQCAVTVLSERHPEFELPPNERFAANIRGKVLKYSPELRKGLAESLALLGVQPSDLKYCSQNKPENTAVLTVRKIFESADWVLWGSLDDLLPTLAEAAPDEFLTAVEKALQQVPCPFDELFSQEGSGFTGRNYLTGLLWALETLAWDDEFLVRVCVILGELADRDPGGNWANRPVNSLTTILLPCIPQTTAPFSKRRAALQTLRKEVPAVAWKVLLKLLPGETQTSMPTHRPSWRNTIPNDWNDGVTRIEYWEQVSYFAELTVEMASDDVDKLKEIVGQLDNLTRPAFDKILEYLSSKAVTNKPEDQRLGLWTQLTMFTRKHRRFSDAKWALSSELVSKIEGVADKLAPQNVLHLHRVLFSRYNHDLYEETGNFEAQDRKLEERRRQAAKDILDNAGMEAVVQFSKDVELPHQLGHSLGFVATAEFDDQILPAMLVTDDRKLSDFTGSYIWSRRHKNGWEWVDGLDRSAWSTDQMGQFLSCLPFTQETWSRAADWLGKFDREYWTRTNVSSFDASADNGIAIDKLIENGRPRVAIACLGRMLHGKRTIDVNQAVRALHAVGTSSEPLRSMDTYDITKIIKALQDDPETDPEDLFRIEWAYLPLLASYSGDATPKTLENRLASDPDFFCEVIRCICPSKKELKRKEEITEQDKAIAQNAWKLLHEWRIPPGTQPDGTFLPDKFNQWLKQVRESCNESGHLEAAFEHVGQVLFHCQPDPTGLWIHHAVADALNDRGSKWMRAGYVNEDVNSRGAHYIDPTGGPERKIAQQYRQKAEDVENAGYQRFATELRRMAKGYDLEAERIIAEHRRENTGESDEKS